MGKKKKETERERDMRVQNFKAMKTKSRQEHYILYILSVGVLGLIY